MVESEFKNNVYNTPFEMSLRILLMLSIDTNTYFTYDRILALDFINCYAKEFELSDENLYGINDCMRAEIANRRLLVKEAIKILVMEAYLQVKLKKGFTFKITKTGRIVAENLASMFAVKYKAVARLSINRYKKEKDEELLKKIQLDLVVEQRGGRKCSILKR